MITPITPQTAYLHTCLEFEEARERLRIAEREAIDEALGMWNPLAVCGALIAGFGVVICIVALVMLAGRMA